MVDVAGNTSAVKTSAAFKFDNTQPNGSISFTGKIGSSGSAKDVYLTGSSWGTTPYASVSTSDGHSGVKSSSLSCTSSNTNIATVSNTGTKTNITIKSRKGSINQYNYLEEYTTIKCTLTVTDNAGNSKTITLNKNVGNGWVASNKRACPSGSYVGEHSDWYYSNGLNKVVGWIYVYNIFTTHNLYYYTNSNGLVLTGWQQIGGVWYYLNDICTFLTTYTTTSGYNYPDGAMVWSDTLVRSDGSRWTFNESGACISGSGC